MKKLIAVILVIACLIGITSCGPAEDPSGTTGTVETTQTTETTGTTGTTQTTETTDDGTEPEPEHVSVLFIGSDYTSANDMPGIYFKQMMQAAKTPATIQFLTASGQHLIDSANETVPFGARVDAALKSYQYDYVVIQEDSDSAALNPAKYYTGMRRLVTKIRESGAKPLIFATWAKKEGHTDLTAADLTNESMTWKLAAAAEAIGDELDVEVIHVGLAFFDVSTNNSSIELYKADGSLPTEKGSLLVSYTVFAKITGSDLTKLSYGTSAEYIILKEAARKAVFDPPAIPGEYRTSSVGVEYGSN